MKIIKIVLISIVLILVAFKSSTAETKKPKNVILLISDGTGLSQISSAFYFKETKPNYTRFKHIGLIKTSSALQDVTDSGAGATAFACGVKTYNNGIGIASDGSTVKNLVEIASAKNIKTGVIATSSITHATPAGFYAHVAHRKSSEKIALQLLQSNIDFFAGGGLQYFNDRKDEQDLFKIAKENNFTIDTLELSDISKIQSNKKMGYLLAKNALKPVSDGRGNFLAEVTTLATQFLNKDKSGFFLMSEGSQIDWGGHNNDAEYLVSELIDFDDAVGKALDFAEKDGNTLVIVTSDHETGGFTLASKRKKKSNGEEYNDYSEIDMKFSTNGHSATLIPVFAYGPGAEEFIGIYENTGIFDKILKVTNWGTEE